MNKTDDNSKEAERQEYVNKIKDENTHECNQLSKNNEIYMLTVGVAYAIFFDAMKHLYEIGLFKNFEWLYFIAFASVGLSIFLTISAWGLQINKSRQTFCNNIINRIATLKFMNQDTVDPNDILKERKYSKMLFNWTFGLGCIGFGILFLCVFIFKILIPLLKYILIFILTVPNY